ncbi:hypothetical protein [Sorangium sp. So ce1000]
MDSTLSTARKSPQEARWFERKSQSSVRLCSCGIAFAMSQQR